MDQRVNTLIIVDLSTKSKRALKAIISQCTHLSVLEPLLNQAPPNILKYILNQFKQCLPIDVQSRRSFVQSGSLQIIQQLKEEATCAKLIPIIEEINKWYLLYLNHSFPADIVQYYSPGFSKTLLSKIDEYEPRVAQN